MFAKSAQVRRPQAACQRHRPKALDLSILTAQHQEDKLFDFIPQRHYDC